MTWFKICDRFAGHRKLENLHRLARGDGTAFAAAVTTWTLMGVDCAARETDGEFFEERAYRVVMLERQLVVAALKHLEAAGFLEKGAEDESWRFHDWLDYQPSQEQIRAERAAKAQRQSRWRNGKGSRDAARDASRDAAGDASRDAAPSRPDPTRPAPTRPVPTRPVPTQRGEEQQGKPSKRMNGSGAEAPLDVQTPSRVKREASSPREVNSAVSEVFAHWQQATNKPRAKLDSKRRTVIARALGSWSQSEISRCIDGYAKSPFHRGENERGCEYLELTLMLRDAEHVEKGLELSQGTARRPAPAANSRAAVSVPSDPTRSRDGVPRRRPFNINELLGDMKPRVGV